MPLRTIAKKVHILTKPKAVRMAELFGTDKGGVEKGIDFFSGIRYKDPITTQSSEPARYPWHYDFFANYDHGITSFADVGCALPLGAPTTIVARAKLPEATRVFAVDVLPAANDHELRNFGITPMQHSIVRAPLPKTVDAIRFANVAQWLTQSARRRALVNIHRSLNSGGLLFSERKVYRKKGRGFEIIAEADRSTISP